MLLDKLESKNMISKKQIEEIKVILSKNNMYTVSKILDYLINQSDPCVLENIIDFITTPYSASVVKSLEGIKRNEITQSILWDSIDKLKFIKKYIPKDENVVKIKIKNIIKFLEKFDFGKPIDRSIYDVKLVDNFIKLLTSRSYDGFVQKVVLSRTKDQGRWRTWFIGGDTKKFYIKIHPCNFDDIKKENSLIIEDFREDKYKRMFIS
jgi:hypothetical protein